MARVIHTQRFSFQSVHSLPVGPQRERRHGHHYGLELSYSDCDPKLVEQIAKHLIESRLHGHELTGELEPSTGEHLVEWIHEKLLGTRLGPYLRGVALQETRKNRFVSSRTERELV